MKKLIIIICLLPLLSNAQTIEDIVKSIEHNNSTLQAFQASTKANKIENKINIMPENPNIDFTYSWGNAFAPSDKINFSATQTFDFPSVYTKRAQISTLQNEQADLQLAQQRMNIIKEAKIVYNDIIYYNILIKDLNRFSEYFNNLSIAYKKKLDAGEISIFDYNKVKITNINIEQRIKLLEVERNSLLQELTRLNGGQSLEINSIEFPQNNIPTQFDQWISTAENNNPYLKYLNKEVIISEKNVQLNQGMAAPKFTVGYALENIGNEQFNGIIAGISIPLWGNSNRIKQSKARQVAVQSIVYDNHIQFYNHLQGIHSRLQTLNANIAEYQKVLSDMSQFDLLQKALEKGEISIVEYLVEYTVYHESHEQMMSMQREAAHCAAELDMYN